MNRKEKDEREDLIFSEAKKTEEGRLKIEKIIKYRQNADQYMRMAYHRLYIALFYAMSILVNKFVLGDGKLIRGVFSTLEIYNIIRSLPHVYKKIKLDRLIHNHEEEILHQSVK